jgi:hypothetical protein
VVVQPTLTEEDYLQIKPSRSKANFSSTFKSSPSKIRPFGSKRSSFNTTPLKKQAENTIPSKIEIRPEIIDKEEVKQSKILE